MFSGHPAGNVCFKSGGVSVLHPCGQFVEAKNLADRARRNEPEGAIQSDALPTAAFVSAIDNLAIADGSEISSPIVPEVD